MVKLSTSLMVGAVALVAGFALGAALVGRSHPRRVEATAATASSPVVPIELAQTLAELARALDELRATLARPSAAPVVTPGVVREPVIEAGVSSASEALAFELRSVAQSLRELRTRGEPREPGVRPEDLVIPARIDRADAFAATGMLPAARSGEEAWAAAESAFRRAHLFLTNQELLDVYGAPDEIELGENDAESWQYVLDHADCRETLGFLLKSGCVREAWYSLD
ncbi:MAG: hypothetical protein ABL998_13335 [Planctomycetota bacterium]